MTIRTRRFNKEFPEGKLFTDKDELDKALQEEDWWDAEWKVGKEPSLKEVLIAKSVPKEDKKHNNNLEKKDIKDGTFDHEMSKLAKNTCKCGCGKEIMPGKKYASIKCYHSDVRKKAHGNR